MPIPTASVLISFLVGFMSTLIIREAAKNRLKELN